MQQAKTAGIWRQTRRLSASLALAALVAGGATAPAMAAKKTIAIIVPTLKITVLQVESKAGVQEAHRLGYNAVVLTHNFNTAKELQDAQQLITEHVAGVAWNVADPAASAVAVEKVRAAGIPVVNMDRVLVKHKIANASYQSDNFQCGALSAKAFVKLVGDKGTYAEISGPKSDHMARTRSAGYHSVLDKTGLKMAARQSAAYDETKGFQLAGSILQAHPHILGFISGNDFLGLGAAAAIKSQGKKGMAVVGIDGGTDAVAAIDSGTSAFRATAAQPVAQLAKDAVDRIVAILHGKPGLSNGAKMEIPCTLDMKK